MVQDLKCFKLESKNPSKEFILHNSSSVISIRKITIDSLLDKSDDNWFCELYKMNFYLEMKGKGRFERPIDIPFFTFMSVNPIPREPIFHFNHDFIFPDYNIGNESPSDFCKEVSIEMKPIRDQLIDGISLTFFYEATPGVLIKNN